VDKGYVSVRRNGVFGTVVAPFSTSTMEIGPYREVQWCKCLDVFPKRLEVSGRLKSERSRLTKIKIVKDECTLQHFGTVQVYGRFRRRLRELELDFACVSLQFFLQEREPQHENS
jgi:hypothetical protein